VPVNPAAAGWTSNPLYTVEPIVALSLLDLDYWITLDPNSAAALEGSMTVRVTAFTSPDTATPWLSTLPDEIPIANDDNYATSRGAFLSVDAPGVLANDEDDNDGIPLSAFLVDETVHGDIELAENGFFRYLPDLDFVGTDTFTYYASDGTARSNIATVTITVVDSSSDGDGGGGGCTIQRNGPFAPTLPLVVLASIAYLLLRTRKPRRA
jgi:hypothetical protein